MFLYLNGLNTRSERNVRRIENLKNDARGPPSALGSWNERQTHRILGVLPLFNEVEWQENL